MKKLVRAILAVTMVVSLTACTTKNSKNPTGSDNSGSDVIIVGTEAGFAPYEYMEGDQVVGIDMDISYAIAEALGKKLEIKNMDFDGALVAVQQGKVDFVAAGVSINKDREKNMDFSDYYVDNTEVIVVNKENPTVANIDDLEGKVIGVQQGNIADIWCSNEENITPKEIKRYTKFVQAAEDLANGKIDCIVMDQYPAQDLVNANNKLTILEGELFQDQYAIAVKKGNKELLDQINTVIKQLKEDGKIEEFTAKHAGK